MDLRGIECRIARLERATGRRDPEAEAIIREAEERVWPQYSTLVEPILKRFENDSSRFALTLEEEKILDALWDALHEEARRLAEARGIAWDRVLKQLTI